MSPYAKVAAMQKVGLNTPRNCVMSSTTVPVLCWLQNEAMWQTKRFCVIGACGKHQGDASWCRDLPGGQSSRVDQSQNRRRRVPSSVRVTSLTNARGGSSGFARGSCRETPPIAIYVFVVGQYRQPLGHQLIYPGRIRGCDSAVKGGIRQDVSIGRNTEGICRLADNTSARR